MPKSLVDQINEKYAARAEVSDKVQALAGKEADGEQLTAEEVAEVTQLQAQFDEISASINRLEKAEAMAAATAKPLPSYGRSGNNDAPAVHVKQAAPADYPGAKMARMAMAIAASGGNLTEAADFAANKIGDQEVAMAVETRAGSAGALVPTNLSDEVIEELTPKTIARALGATSVPLPNGNLTISQDQGGAISYYIGEGQDAKVSETSYGDVELRAKKVITMVPMSSEAIGYTGPRVERMVLNSMMTAMRLREDMAVLRDDGTNNTPKGFRTTAIENGRTIPFLGDPKSLTDIDEYLDLMILRLVNANSNMLMPGWGLSPRTWMKLQGLRDGNGNKVYPEMAQGMLKGYPFRTTTQIPANLGAGSNETEIYFADWVDVMIGETDGMAMDFTTEAAYIDKDGNLQSAYSKDQALIRLKAANDVGFRHIEGLALGTGVTF